MPLNFGAIGKPVGPHELAYDWDDIVLYNLALGTPAEQLDFLVDPEPKVLPTWGVIPATKPMFDVLELAQGDLTHLLHSAQLTEQVRPFPPRGVVHTTATLLGIYDMRIGALLQIESRSTIRDELYARTVWTVLITGEGNFQSERAPGLLRTKPPRDAAPDFTVTWATQPTQALLYRLTGDLNPIHARPEAASAAGLERPILHGLCTYGFAARAALASLCGGDPRRFRTLEARFTKPVVPGQTLTASGYVLAPGEAALTVQVVETGELAIANALFRYEV